MIIQIRGTSGSGKTTAVKDFMSLLLNKGYVETPIMLDGSSSFFGRKQPISHKYKAPEYVHLEVSGRVVSDYPDVYFLGHYNTPCGGVDTITNRQFAFDLATSYPKNSIVIMEGVIMSDDVGQTSKLTNVFVFLLDTKIEDCLAGIQSRRLAKGNTKELNPDNTTKRQKAIVKACERLKANGVPVSVTSRSSILDDLCSKVFAY